MEVNFGTLLWICDNCHEVREMVVEDLFYDGSTCRIEARCSRCRKVLSIDIGALINATKSIVWDE